MMQWSQTIWLLFAIESWALLLYTRKVLMSRLSCRGRVEMVARIGRLCLVVAVGAELYFPVLTAVCKSDA